MKRKVKFWNSNFNFIILGKHWVLQKIIGINRNVPWPVHWTTKIKAPEKIDPGSRCPGLSPWCYLDGRNGIIIGDNVWIGPRVSIISMNHLLDDYYTFAKDEPVVIGENSWIGTGAIILPGVKLGNHVIVGAGAIVTKSFDLDNIVLGGNPARIIKRISPYVETN